MEKSLSEFFYGDKNKSAQECFENKMKEIEISHEDFLKKNNIEFKLSYVLQFDSHSTSLIIIDKEIEKKMGNEIKNAFDDCFNWLSDNES